MIGSAGLGSTLGIALGSVLRRIKPEITVVVVLLADTAVTVLVALFYGLPTAVLLGLTAGLAQSLGKLSLDALIQRDVPERTRAGTFARSETLLQLSWVVGGLIGIALPLVPQVGLGIAAAILVGWTLWVLTGLRTRRSRAPRVARARARRRARGAPWRSAWRSLRPGAGPCGRPPRRPRAGGRGPR